MQIIRMNSPNSNVFLLTRGSVRSIPTTIETLGTIFPLMNSIGMFKVRILPSNFPTLSQKLTFYL